MKSPVRQHLFAAGLLGCACGFVAAVAYVQSRWPVQAEHCMIVILGLCVIALVYWAALCLVEDL
jgi:hypothetical protein